MANEISYSVSFTATKGGASVSTGTWSDTVDMAGADMISATQNIGTSDEALDFGDITSPAGRVAIKNLDATNYVELSLATGGSFDGSRFAKIGPGEAIIYCPAVSGTIYAQADTASCLVQVVACEP